MTGPCVDIIDVGHGNASAIRAAEKVVVVDAGPGKDHLLSYLNRESIERVETILISHADEDHLRGLVAVMDSAAVEIGEILVNPDASKTSRLWDAFTFAMEQRVKSGESSHRPYTAGEVITIDGESPVSIEIMAPQLKLFLKGPGSTDDRGIKLTSNTLSGVVRASCEEGGSVLLAGDIDEVGLHHLAENHDLSSDVLVYPHHGGNSSNSATEERNREFATTLVTKAAPEMVIFSNGRKREPNPRKEVVDAIRSSTSSTIACSQLCRACSPEDIPDGADVELPLYSAGFVDDMSHCAGSSRVCLLDGTISHTRNAHRDFVDHSVPGALCRT